MNNLSLNDETVYWLSNPQWYRINKEKDCFEMTDAAPEKARISFEIWSGKRKSAKKKTFFSNMKI